MYYKNVLKIINIDKSNQLLKFSHFHIVHIFQTLDHKLIIILKSQN